MNDDLRAELEEYERRVAAKASEAEFVRRIRAELFAEQLDFVDDPAREKAALCTRRAGKTSMWVRYCTILCRTSERALIRIWGITRLRAKQLLWDEFHLLFARHGLKANEDYVSNSTELTIKFSNGSEIRLLGADKDKEVEKKRGDKTDMEVVLEAQLFGSLLRKLVEEVAGPCLFDKRGVFCLEGTPGPICNGYWFDVSGGNDLEKTWVSQGQWHEDRANDERSLVGQGWSVHRWSVLDNPFLPHAREELARLKAKRRWKDDSPTYVREWLAKWVNDLSAMFYRFDPLRNTYEVCETFKPWGPGWEHTLGWDLGALDDMAIVVWGYHPNHPELYEAFSWKKPGALSSEVIGIINDLETKGVDGTPFNIVARVADTGGGGKMYVNEVVQRYGMMFEPAKKTEKYEHVRMMNDDLAGGFAKLQAGSPYAEEIAALPRDVNYADDHPDALPREHPGSPNHCCDAGLYGWRRAWHYLHRDEPAKPKPGTPGWFAQEANRMEQTLIDREQRRQAELELGLPFTEIGGDW